MPDDTKETLRDLDPVRTMQESLKEQGFFSRVNQGARQGRDGVEIVYQAVVLDDESLEVIMAQANTWEGYEVSDPKDLSWEDLEQLTVISEGTDLRDALQTAVEVYFSQ